jgi:tetratricopeptide (TPR) repeat protein
MAQKGKVAAALAFIEQGNIEKAKECIDLAVNDEKSKNWFNTYLAKGELCMAIFEAEDQKYASYFTDPLTEALVAFEKAMELDTKGTAKKKLITNLTFTRLAENFFKQGSKCFTAEDYQCAFKSFVSQINITEGDLYVGVLDTGMYYNAGLAAINSKQFSEGIKYFEKCAEMQYQGIIPYFQVYDAYLNSGDTARAEAYLLNLGNKFPDEYQVTLRLIDLYILQKKNDQALKYILEAKEKEPDNISLYFVSGIMYLNQSKFDESITEFTRALEMKTDRGEDDQKPELFDIYYDLGAAYVNKAGDMHNKANDIMDVNQYNAAVEEINKVYRKALPYLQSAHDIKPEDKDTMYSLRELYYRLKMTEEYNEIKAKLNALHE